MFGDCWPAARGADCDVATEASVRAAGRRREAVAIAVVRRAVREKRAADMAGCGFWEYGAEYNQEPDVGKTNCRCSSALGAVPLRTGGSGGAWVRERVGGGRRAAFSLVMSCAERSGLEGLVISRGKSVPLGLGTLS